MPEAASAMSTVPAYRSIADRVSAGTLSLTFVFGPPRGGTTASERWLFESFHFDGNVNQPGLLARDGNGERERVQATWATVLDKVLSLEETSAKVNRNLATSPLTLVIKETSNVVLPCSEMKLWLSVCSSIMLVYRNPVLQMESRICCILNRISAGATADLGVPPDLDPRTFTIAGLPLIVPGTDFSHIDAANTSLSLWEQHYKHMKKNRDYTSLDKGYIRFCVMHPLFEEPEVQRECLELWRSNNPAAGVTQQQIEQCVGTRLEQFDTLPNFFHQAFFEWRFGWTEFMAQIDACKGFDSMTLLDMSDLQSGPAHYFDQIENLITHSSAEDVARAAACEEGGNGFDLSSQGADWDKWFLSSCDWDKMSKTADIKPPDKGCCPFASFPTILRTLMPKIMDDFVSVRKDKRTLRAPKEVLEKFVGIDGVSDYVNLVTAGAQLPELVRRRAEMIKGGGDSLYLDMIDRVFVDERGMHNPNKYQVVDYSGNTVRGLMRLEGSRPAYVSDSDSEDSMGTGDRFAHHSTTLEKAKSARRENGVCNSLPNASKAGAARPPSVFDVFGLERPTSREQSRDICVDRGADKFN